MHKALRIIHFLGLAAFLGSVFGHILLGRLVDPVAEPSVFVDLMWAKHASTAWLTVPGLVVTMLSGLGLVATRPALLRHRWLPLKIGLAFMVAANGSLLLEPLGQGITEAAQQVAALHGTADGEVALTRLAVLTQRESLLGAANLLLVLVILTLGVVRPRLRANPADRSPPSTHATAGV